MKHANSLDKNLGSTVPSLLNEFIHEVMKEEEEAGVSRLQLRKFHAACLMLAYTPGLRLRQIAQLAKVSNERLIRNWRTEDKFNAEVHKFISMYAEKFVQNLQTSNLLLESFDYLLVDEFCSYSKILRIKIMGYLEVAVKNPIYADTLQDMRNRCLFGFTELAMYFTWAGPQIEMQIRSFSETWHKQFQIYLRSVRIVYTEAIKAKDLELAKQMFEAIYRRAGDLEEKLCYQEKELIQRIRSSK